MATINRKAFFNHFMQLYLEQSQKFTQGQVYRFLFDLHQQHLLFHLDDDPYDLVNAVTNDATFSKYEAAILAVIVPTFFGTDTLPDYEGDPHRIAIDLAMPYSPSTPSTHPYDERTPPVLPRWGFSFDDQRSNHYIGFTLPRTWNGWGVPMLPYSAILEILLDGRYRFDVIGMDVLVHGDSESSYQESDYIRLKATSIMDRSGISHVVYDTSPLGLTFNIDDCQEANAHDWVGYL